MKLSGKGCVVAALVAAGSLAHAAPPTVVPSPGYDARLQEQRAAAAAAARPSTSMPPAAHHHRKKTH